MLYPFSQVHTVFEHLRKIQSSILGKTIIEIVYLSPRPEIKKIGSSHIRYLTANESLSVIFKPMF